MPNSRTCSREVEAIQQAAFSKVKAGALGGDIIAEAEAKLKASPSAEFTDFFAHGMGLITHEAPFLMTNHPVAYEGIDADRPLEANMVISVETTMLHPTRGFIKLEDTLAITSSGYEMFGDTRPRLESRRHRLALRLHHQHRLVAVEVREQRLQVLDLRQVVVDDVGVGRVAASGSPGGSPRPGRRPGRASSVVTIGRRRPSAASSWAM